MSCAVADLRLQARRAPAARASRSASAGFRAPTRRPSCAGSPAARPRSAAMRRATSCLPARSAFSCASWSSTSRTESVVGAAIVGQLLSRRVRRVSELRQRLSTRCRGAFPRRACPARSTRSAAAARRARPGGRGDRGLERGQRRLRGLLLGRGLLARGERGLERRVGRRAIARQARFPAPRARRAPRSSCATCCVDARLRLARERAAAARGASLRHWRRRTRPASRAARRPRRSDRVRRASSRASAARDLRLHGLERDGERRRSRSCSARGARTASCCFANHEQVLRQLEARLELAVLGGHLRLLVEARRAGCRARVRMSSTRDRFSRVSASRPSVSLRRSLYLDTPAASSRKMRSSSGLRLDHARDHPLLDDRVGARPQAGAEEEIVDVAAADRDVVDVVGRVAVARQHALDRDLGVLAPLAADAARGCCRSAARPTRARRACARRRR